MRLDGIRYFITPLFENMDPTGRVRQRGGRKWNLYQERWGQQTQDKSQAPIAPPMSEMRNIGNNHKVNPQFQKVALYHMLVTRIYCDHQYVDLYQNNTGMIFKMMSQQETIYPLEITLHVYGEIKMGEVQLYDDWNNIYHHVLEENLGKYMW